MQKIFTQSEFRTGLSWKSKLKIHLKLVYNFNNLSQSGKFGVNLSFDSFHGHPKEERRKKEKIRKIKKSKKEVDKIRGKKGEDRKKKAKI